MSGIVARFFPKLIVGFILGAFWLTFMAGSSFADDAREANQAYENENYQKAERLYRRAIDKTPDRTQLYFNLANALAKQGKTEDAIKMYNRFKSMSDNAEDKAKANYNIANLHSDQKNFGKAMDFYKQSLRYDPDDKEAKHNYELAYQKKRQNPKQNKKNQDQGDQNKNNKDKQDKKNQQNNDQKQKENNKSKNQQNSDSDNDNKNKQNSSDQSEESEQNKNQQEKKAQPQPNRISKAEAQQILQALENREKKLLQQLRKKQSKSQSSNEKDW